MARALFDEGSEEVGKDLNDKDEQENLDQEINNSDVDEGNENSEANEEDSEEYFVARDKKIRMVGKKSPIVSKINKINENNIVKIFPGPEQCARDITDGKSGFDK
ncbi:hypothetical protein JTB14_031789 [Gonioctena quinquepunctata]|nr:hypothetical protein JTB14_031789 [Gonioctena quinquepunctata]